MGPTSWLACSIIQIPSFSEIRQTNFMISTIADCMVSSTRARSAGLGGPFRARGVLLAETALPRFVKEQDIKVLNVAGPRASKESQVVRQSDFGKSMVVTMKALPDGHYLRAAQGCVELGNYFEAKE